MTRQKLKKQIGGYGIAFFGCAFLAFTLSGFNPSSLVQKQSSAASSDLKLFLSGLNGTIIFDSTRSGSFGIYKFNADSLKPEVLIDTALDEEHPDPSPDGTQIVYSLSKTTNDKRVSEIWIASADGTKRRKLVDSGSFPTFSRDGKTVYYSFEERKVMAFSFANNSSREIFPKKRKKFRNRPIKNPRVSPNGEYISFTTNLPDYWHTWIAPLSRGAPTMMHRGCQANWFPNSKRLAWVKRSGAKALAGIMWYERGGTPQIGVLKDDGAPMGHEYFPKVTDSGEHLLYAACPHDQHDHKTAAYALHATNLRSGETHRLTLDGSTDRWPKLLISR